MRFFTVTADTPNLSNFLYSRLLFFRTLRCISLWASLCWRWLFLLLYLLHGLFLLCRFYLHLIIRCLLYKLDILSRHFLETFFATEITPFRHIVCIIPVFFLWFFNLHRTVMLIWHLDLTAGWSQQLCQFFRIFLNRISVVSVPFDNVALLKIGFCFHHHFVEEIFYRLIFSFETPFLLKKEDRVTEPFRKTVRLTVSLDDVPLRKECTKVLHVFIDVYWI